MKCRLCDRPTTPGTGKLCLDCTKALHRARAGSAAVRKQPASPPVQPETMATMGPPPTVTPASVPGPRWRRHGTWAAAGLVAIGMVYFAQSGPEPRRALDAAVVDRAPASSTKRSQVDLSVVSTSVEAPSSTTQAVAPEAPASSPAPQTKAELRVAKTPPSAGTKTTARTGTASTNANRDSSASSTAYARANDAATSKSEAPAESETSQLLAQGSISQSSSPTDGAHAWASALEKCGKEAFLSRFVCEQKMYMQYCEDKWDKDPRCMRRTANN
jgi:hypothetical protein